MISDKIKVRVSSFVADIIENDALCFGFMKNKRSNKNAFLNKLIPTLVEVRKMRREQIEDILKNEYDREDSVDIYNAVNTVIDRVYFSDEELNDLDDEIWIRPTKDSLATFDEIENSEIIITAQELSVYIRGLLNEYCRLPQYKRETLTFDHELDVFSDSSNTGQIIHFTDRETGEQYKAFAVHTYYGYTYDQVNNCVIYDIKNNKIKSIPLNRVYNIYTIKQKFKPSEYLIEQLQKYIDDGDFDKEISVECE